MHLNLLGNLYIDEEIQLVIKQVRFLWGMFEQVNFLKIKFQEQSNRLQESLPTPAPILSLELIPEVNGVQHAILKKEQFKKEFEV
jgi:hypothetical protein